MMGTMKNTTDNSQQLTLLPSAEVPLQFRISETNRRRGLQHIAEIRLQMAARRSERVAATTQQPSRMPKRPTAA